MLNGRQAAVLAILAMMVLELCDKRLGIVTVNPDPLNVSVTKCTYVRDLMDNGISQDEAFQNMDCCTDPTCPFHTSRY